MRYLFFTIYLINLHLLPTVSFPAGTFFLVQEVYFRTRYIPMLQTFFFTIYIIIFQQKIDICWSKINLYLKKLRRR